MAIVQHFQLVLAACISLLLSQSYCALDLEWGDDSDLSHFVTRPEIRAPILNVNVRDESNVSPGYYFAGHYALLHQEKPAPRYYEACQTGPHIYDKNGNLVWSGACVFKNRNMADFRSVQTANGSFLLSGIQMDLSAGDTSPYGDGKTRGQGLVLDETYKQQAVVAAPANTHSFNMHDLKLLNDGKSALHLLWKPEYLDVSDLNIENRTAGWVGAMGFRETDVVSGKTLFEWWSLQHVPLSESNWPTQGIEGPSPTAWDYIHIDAVDKTPEGDYLVSARHTDSIYKIARDGGVMWRLGGSSSSFEMDGLSFARQHDVRTVDAESLGLTSDPTVEYISLFNNAGDELEAELPSSALVIRLDIVNWKASALRQVQGENLDPTFISGNSQILPNGNTLTSWGGNNYVSEHDMAGNLIAEARFGDRFLSYRTYKLDWRAQPDETELVLKCTAWGTSPAKATTICHVSWNGATEVSSWRFLARSSPSSSAHALHTVPKDGFETKLEAGGYSQFVSVEALDCDGRVLGTSSEVSVGHPEGWPSTV